MQTRKNVCFPTFHSTSTTSSPSERATLSAAARIFSKFTWRLPGHGRYQVLPNRRKQKSGLAPTHRCDRFRVKLEDIPAPRQKQGTQPSVAVKTHTRHAAATRNLLPPASILRPPQGIAHPSATAGV